MFTELSARRFKSWRDLTPIRLGPVTGFFGANSSGKTSLMQVILLLKQTSESSDRGQPLELGDERTPIELGSFRDVLWRHKGGELSLAVGWSVADNPIDVLDSEAGESILFRVEKLGFETRMGLTPAGGIEVLGFRYDTGNAVVTMERSSRKRGRRDAEYDLNAVIDGQSYLRRTPGRAWALPAPVKCYGFPDEAVAYYQNSGFVGDLELAFDRQFAERTFYLGPLRSSPSREYRWKGTRPSDVGVAGERAVEALLASRARGSVNTRAYNARGRAVRRITVEEHVAQWLEELNLVHSFRVQQLASDVDIYRVLVKKDEASEEVLLTDVGFGVSQILPVLVLLAFVPEGSTVLLEQPELHLHPAVQSRLADIIIEAAVVRKVQVVLESHSEHLLRRLQLRVADGRIPVEDVRLYFCNIEDGDSKIEPLALNVFGEISNWPVDFFGDPMGEMAAITRAAIRRRRAQAS